MRFAPRYMPDPTPMINIAGVGRHTAALATSTDASHVVAAQQVLLAERAAQGSWRHADRRQLARLYADSSPGATPLAREHDHPPRRLTREWLPALVDELRCSSTPSTRCPMSNLLNLGPLRTRANALALHAEQERRTAAERPTYAPTDPSRGWPRLGRASPTTDGQAGAFG